MCCDWLKDNWCIVLVIAVLCLCCLGDDTQNCGCGGRRDTCGD